jgi:hypothetical protein
VLIIGEIFVTFGIVIKVTHTGVKVIKKFLDALIEALSLAPRPIPVRVKPKGNRR